MSNSSVAGRTWVSLVDQAVSSGTNFALALLAARLVGPEGLGAVTVGVAIAYAGIAFERALVGEPLLVLARTNGSRGALETAVVAGLLLGIIEVGVGAWLGGEVGLVISVVGLFGPVLLFQDAGRYQAIALGSHTQALASDLTWFVTQTGLLLFFLLSGLRSPVLVVASWGLGASAGALVLLSAPLERMTSVVIRQWLRHSAKLGGWMSAQTVVGQVGSQVTLIAVGSVTGLAGLGILRAVQAVTGPLSVLFLGLTLVALPAFADAATSAGPEGLRRQVLRWALACGFLSLTYGLIVVALRTPILTGLFGNSFQMAVPLALPAAVALLGLGLGAAPGWGIRALSAGWAVFTTQVIGTAAGIPLIVLMATASGAEGAAWGVAVQAGIVCALSWAMFGLAMRSARFK
jgi:O-antigen/teichoic acid export membrane protein